MGIEKQYNEAGVGSAYAEATEATAEKDEGRAFLHERVRNFDSDSNLLDVGCGSGLDLHAYKEMGFSNLYGVDTSEGLLQRAQELLGKDAKLSAGSIEALPLQDESMDEVTARFSLHYARDMEKAIREVACVLRTNGTFLAVISNPEADALEEVDENGNITITLFDGKVSITYPLHTVEEYFSDTFYELFELKELSGYTGVEQDRDTGKIPNALCFTAQKK